ncbi:Zn-dependent hydrolase [Brevibacillus ruminantium]|uniref:Zn-dependent hydrolase n=1 Tax=Brevibacillus ruminantium TaxID=2950604 RepID=A0ABY4WF52_9BACL|nr:Zn-dependent hydrolase [Brevibacillus ruminantium]USG65476.1 Zn-dependent hydrolase [Brevibacillus ruminantium]
MNISIERLLVDLEKYAAYGKSAEGGITRPSFSEPDFEVRELYVNELKELGLDVSIDGAANIWGRLPGTGEKKGTIVIGSHLDTVPNGGKYDGALGVLLAKEIIRTLIDSGVRLQHDLEIVSFTAEEPNDFNLSTFGSRCLTGKLTTNQLETVTDSKGYRLADGLIRAGGGLHKFAALEQIRSEKKAYIELHIEQGRRLAAKNIPVASVDRIVGIYRDKITVLGEANHAGTTMMEHRVDALSAAAELILIAERIARQDPKDTVCTIGKLDVFPNAANIIPGTVEFILEVRGESRADIEHLVSQIKKEWEPVKQSRAIEIREQTILNQSPVEMDGEIVTLIEQAAQDRLVPCLRLASMAGHDASHMADISKAAMIFVKSPNGKSHCPEEFSTSEDIEIAGNVMLDAIVKVDRQLD